MKHGSTSGLIAGFSKLFKDHPAWLLIALLIAASIGFALFSAWKGYPPYRDIHLGTAIEYAENGIRLDNTKIVGSTRPAPPPFRNFRCGRHWWP